MSEPILPEHLEGLSGAAADIENFCAAIEFVKIEDAEVTFNLLLVDAVVFQPKVVPIFSVFSHDIPLPSTTGQLS
jgi:hypothetical protein